jgi:hypothetical protein
LNGKIANASVSILIDSREIHSYIAPDLVEQCYLKKSKHDKSWLVELVIRTK